MGEGLKHKTKSVGSRVLKVQKSTLLKASPILILTIFTLTVFTTQALESGDRVRVDSSTLEWVEPFQHDLSSMPVDYSSGEEPEVGIDFKKSSVNNPDEINYLYKKASDTGFTEVEQQPILSRYHHTDSQNDATYDNTVYWYQDVDNIQVDEAQSKTFFVNGNEHTIFAEDIIGPNKVDIDYDGVSYNGLHIGESIDADNGNEFTLVVDDITETTMYFEVFENKFEVGDGHYRLLARAKEDGQHQYNKPLYFETTNGGTIPFIEKITYDGKEIDHLNDISNVKTGSEFRVFVRNRENDDFKIFLQDRESSTEIQSAQVNDNFVETIVQEILNEPFPIWYEESQLTQGGDVVEVPFKVTSEDTYLLDQGVSHDIGLKIKQSDGTRLTPDYTITPDQSNAAPSIESIEWDDSCNTNNLFLNMSYLDSRTDNPECIAVKVNDPDTTGGHAVSLNITQNYDGVKHEYYTETVASLGDSDKVSGNTYLFEISNFLKPFNKISDSGTWTAAARVEETGNVDTKTVSWQVPWGDLKVDMVKPSTDLTRNNSDSFEMDLNISCSGGPECVNQNESTSLYWDPKEASN
jgi:hypothetical protein